MTSYCSPPISKRVTWRPPSMVSSVRPIDRDIEAEIGDAVAVDLHLELRLVELEIGVDIGQARILPQALDHPRRRISARSS